MAKIFCLDLMLIVSCGLLFGDTGLCNPQEPKSVSVIPKPMKCTVGRGAPFSINNQTVIVHDEAGAGTARFLARFLRPATGFPFPASRNKETQNAIILKIDGDLASLGKEGYSMSVDHKRVLISAPFPAGLFYGVQTLRQLLPVDLEKGQLLDPTPELNVPALEILDKPRFPWRGMSLDFGRHMFSVKAVKQQLDLMALQKLNVFHMHLTEDQGWRIEIKAYPKLTTVGAYRKMEWSEKDKKSRYGEFATKDEAGNKVYGGFFTQDDIREIVAYATERHITIVPEIEMPGHSTAALASYPNLGCTGGPYEVCASWGRKKDLLCAGKEETFVFLENVLKEVIDLFPGPYIHLGCDEAPTDKWKKCPLCQKRMKDLGLKNEHSLQVWFTDRIKGFLARKNRKVVGWADFLEHSTAKDLAVMIWVGYDTKPKLHKTLLKALENNHQIIQTTGQYCYYNYGYNKTSLETVYSFNPTFRIPPEKHRLIMGSQGNLWTEHITQDTLDLWAYPRLTALSETIWSHLDDKRSFEEFKRRLNVFVKRLDALGVIYTPPEYCDKSWEGQTSRKKK